MAFAEEKWELTPEEVTALFDESLELEDEQPEAGSVLALVERARQYLPELTFVVGLLVGWLVVGGWLWPGGRGGADPWDLRVAHQRTFVTLVAEDYWRTRDVSRARRALAGWDEEALARLLATLESQASTPEARERLAALAEALALPDPRISALGSLFGQKAILFSLILSASPLLVAIALALSPLIGNTVKRRQQRARRAAEAQEVEEGEDASFTSRKRQSQDAEERSESRQAEVREREGQRGGRKGEKGQEGGAEKGEARQKEKEETGEERKVAGRQPAQPGEQAAEEEKGEEGKGKKGAPQQAQEGEGDEEERSGPAQGVAQQVIDEEEETLGEEDGASVHDIFSDLLDDEDETLAQLELLASGLPEVDINDLLWESRAVAKRLRK